MNVFVARQPILDGKGKVMGYELLFRNGIENQFNAISGDKATISVMVDSVFSFGLPSLTNGKKAFLNFTANLLLKQVPTALPQNLAVIEILEDVAPDENILQACEKLKQQGYTLALDDYVYVPSRDPFISLVEIIKVDLMKNSRAQCEQIIKRNRGSTLKFLAEKVETLEEFEWAKAMGFDFFQGYYFSRPTIFTTKDIPVSQHNQLLLFGDLTNLDLDFDQLEIILKRDVSLTVKFLKMLNSSFYGYKSKITSIRQALTLLGLNEVKKWISLILVKDLLGDKPEEILAMSLHRAIFGELIAKKICLTAQSSTVFLAGLLSMVDTLLHHPMEEILSDLPILDEVKQALLGARNVIRDILDLIIAYETGNWSVLSRLASELKLPELDIPDLYMNSLQSTDKMLSFSL